MKFSYRTVETHARYSSEKEQNFSSSVSITFNHKKKGEGENFFSINKKIHGGMRRRDCHYYLVVIFKYDFKLKYKI